MAAHLLRAPSWHSARSRLRSALRELLDPLSIEGRVVTAGSTPNGDRPLPGRGKGRYLFTVDNQKTLANDLKAFDWESIPP